MRAEDDREARHQQTLRYEALARMEHQRRRHQAPKLGPETIYRLEIGTGRGRSERQGEQEGTGGGGAPANQVADNREVKDRLGGAAMQRRGIRASRREDRRVGGGEAGRQE